MESPLNQAHIHAQNAEEFKTRGLLVQAVKEHELAADLFKRAMESSTADATRRTLRMLHTDQTNAHKDLQRKIAEITAQGKDPNTPQVHTRARNTGQLGTPNSSFTHLTPANRSGHNSPQGPHRSLRLSDSQMPIGESYMMLGHHNDAQDPFSDFWLNIETMLDKFSTNPAVAFATAPLSPVSATRDRALPVLQVFSSESDSSEPEDLARFAGRGPRIAEQDQPNVLAGLADALGDGPSGGELNVSLSSTIKPGVLRPTKSKMGASMMIGQEVYANDDGSDSGESFLVIPVAPNIRALQSENAKLKEQLKAAEAKLAVAQQHIKTRAEQEQQLRDGLLSARTQMQQRLGASAILPQLHATSSPKANSMLLTGSAGPGHGSPTFDMSFPNLKLPTLPGIIPAQAPAPVPLGPPGGSPSAASGSGRDREATLLRRTRELEEELRITREDNEKQRAQIVKFRERWTKLKESAKRKKSARAAAEAGRIDEEPEAEAQEDI